MVFTKHRLITELGIDEEIAAFFADRTPPPNNQFWHGKYVYIPDLLGYSFIPMFFDAQYKCGIQKSDLLNEAHIQLMETGFNLMAAYEAEKLKYNDFIKECNSLILARVKNHLFYNDLILHLNEKPALLYKFGTGVKALDRADSFLFLLCDLDIETDILQQVIERWYDIKTLTLIIDDFHDLDLDRKFNQENCILELGDTKKALELIDIIAKNFLDRLCKHNFLLSNYFKQCFEVVKK